MTWGPSSFLSLGLLVLLLAQPAESRPLFSWFSSCERYLWDIAKGRDLNEGDIEKILRWGKKTASADMGRNALEYVAHAAHLTGSEKEALWLKLTSHVPRLSGQGFVQSVYLRKPGQVIYHGKPLLGGVPVIGIDLKTGQVYKGRYLAFDIEKHNDLHKEVEAGRLTKLGPPGVADDSGS